jgi:hypothetical protein
MEPITLLGKFLNKLPHLLQFTGIFSHCEQLQGSFALQFVAGASSDCPQRMPDASLISLSLVFCQVLHPIAPKGCLTVFDLFYVWFAARRFSRLP